MEKVWERVRLERTGFTFTKRQSNKSALPCAMLIHAEPSYDPLGDRRSRETKMKKGGGEEKKVDDYFRAI